MKQLPSIEPNSSGEFTCAQITTKEVELLNAVRGLGYGELRITIKDGQPTRADKLWETIWRAGHE